MNGVVLPYAGDSGTRSFTRYDIRTFRTVYMLLRVGGWWILLLFWIL